MKNTKALIVMDYVNEIAHIDGKFKGKGYADFIIKHNVFNNLNKALETAREKNYLVILVKIGFSSSYIEQPKNSILFGKAKDFNALELNTWATEFHEKLLLKDSDIIMVKSRISPFYGTSLTSFLTANKIDTLYLAGVATDLVVESAARDAHDRDYNINILEECCAAGSDEDHNKGIETLRKISNISDISSM